MKQIVIGYWLSGVILIPTVLCAQAIDSKVLQLYSHSVAVRVYEVTSKANLTPEKQLKLASVFEQQDKALFVLLQEAKPAAYVDSVKNVFNAGWWGGLSAQEQYYYAVARDKEREKFKFGFSQFSAAVQYKDSLGLNTEQVAALFVKIDTLRKMKADFQQKNPGKWFDSKDFESRCMSELLTADQYVHLLTIKNREKAYSLAMADWKELEQRGIATKFIQKDEITLMTNYYVAKLNVQDQFAHDRVKQTAMLKYVNDSKPRILNALLHARRNPENNTQGLSYQW